MCDCADVLLFAFPIVSVDLVEAFACHEVEGRYYLKGDYSIECYTSRWYLMSSYAAIWIVGYIVVFPILEEFHLGQANIFAIVVSLVVELFVLHFFFRNRLCCPHQTP